jgi:hypothetical protein
MARSARFFLLVHITYTYTSNRYSNGLEHNLYLYVIPTWGIKFIPLYIFVVWFFNWYTLYKGTVFILSLNMFITLSSESNMLILMSGCIRERYMFV